MTRVVWTNHEKQLVSEHMVEVALDQPHLGNYELLSRGQMVLPVMRQLTMSHGRVFSHKARIEAARAQAATIAKKRATEKPPERVEAPAATGVPTPAPEPKENPTARLAGILETLLDAIADRVAIRLADWLVSFAPKETFGESHKHNPLPLEEAQVTGKPGVLVIGLLPQQENTIRTIYGAWLDLCFMGAQEAKSRPVMRRAHVVLMTKFINHAIQDKYRQSPMLHFCNGGTSELCKILDKVLHP